MNRMMLTMLAAGLLSLGACGNRETPADTQQDVAEASREGAEDVAEAQGDAVEAGQDVAMAQAKADYDVAIQRCEAMQGDMQESCKREAQAALDAAQMNTGGGTMDGTMMNDGSGTGTTPTTPPTQ